jgi:Tfp pilus assembly protein PilN
MIRINLAPVTSRRAKARPVVDLRLVFGVACVLVAVALAATASALSAELAGLGRDIQRDREEFGRLRAINAEGPRQRADKQELERRVAAIEAVARRQVQPVYLLDALADLPPRDLWMTRVEQKGAQIKLNGVTTSSASLAMLLANLQRSTRFKDVDLVESRQDLAKSPRAIAFEVTCRFEI